MPPRDTANTAVSRQGYAVRVRGTAPFAIEAREQRQRRRHSWRCTLSQAKHEWHRGKDIPITEGTRPNRRMVCPAKSSSTHRCKSGRDKGYGKNKSSHPRPPRV